MNLINDSWIPVRHRNGDHALIASWQITEQHDSNPIVALAAPRADFNGALMQFLIGLLQTSTSAKEDEWEELLEQPPTPDDLKQQFLPHAKAFELAGDGPRFMQDCNLPEGEEKPIAALLIEAPGEKSLRDHTDHFIKRGGVNGLCSACTAAALFTLQTNAPSGGVGHRTSLRGGGPLTTLVIFDPKTAGDDLRATLWRNLWLNVLEKPSFLSLGNAKKTAPADIFPWLAPTRTSEAKTGKQTTPEDTHPAQMFWGMPRRIRLDFKNTEEGHCDICGYFSETLVTRYITKNYGVNYTGPWKHPLSPYNVDKQGVPLPVHAQPGGVSYRHWLGLVQKSSSRESAKIVTQFQEHRKLFHQQFRVWAFGYDMDNMKARCWYEATIPLYELEQAYRKHFEGTVERCINAASEVKNYLVRALKEAWFDRLEDAKGDFSFIDLAFWQNTETDFYGCLQDLADSLQTEADKSAAMDRIRERWYKVLVSQAEAQFDQWATSGFFEYENPRRIAQAYNKLRRQLWGKKLRTDTLELPLKSEQPVQEGVLTDVVTV